MSDDDKLVPASLAERREHAISLLSEHFSRDTLELDEFEKRVALAHRASSLQALDELVADLAPVEVTALAPCPPAELPVPRPARKRVLAIMAGTELKGRWVAPEKMTVTAIMGGVDLDFREAVFAPGVTHVKILAVMGGVDVMVPPHVAVETDGAAILGGFSDTHRTPLAPDPERPILRITGLAALGGVDITTRLPGESGRQARRRQRQERKELAQKRKRELEARDQRLLGDGDD